MDPYIYPNSNVLINNLNIQDEQELIEVEAQLLIAGLVDISSLSDEIDFGKYESLQQIHHFLFHELYSWAGEFRTVNIYKSERVLNGLSVTYSDKDKIRSDLQTIFSWAGNIQWSYSNSFLVEDFSRFMTEIWRIHPYREGNTRTVSIFMKLFAETKGLDFNAQLLSENAGYLRSALVLAAVEEAPDTKHLLKMITEALYAVNFHKVNSDDESSSDYHVIEQYDVSKYVEKPFETEFDKE